MATFLSRRLRALALGVYLTSQGLLLAQDPEYGVYTPYEPATTEAQIAALPPSVGAAAPPNVVHQIRGAAEKMQIVVNSSKIIRLDQKIPKVQVNNKELLEVTPLSPNEVQIFARKAGVTQINLWDEVNNIHTIDIVITPDSRELELVLQEQYRNSNIKVRPIANSVILSGFVDNQEQISGIIKIAEDYYPKVHNNITVGGVQQINLHVKVMEVSRTKLRQLGMDWSHTNGSGDFVVSGVSGLISAASAQAGSAVGNGDTMRFGFVDGNKTFFGFIQALRRYELMKVLAEPTLTTVSGRPAFFNAGGEFPILIPQSLGTVSIQYQKYGTQVDFVPIVLGNGNIRLEVKPRVSEIDSTRSVTINGTTVPGLRVREVDTAVEMKAGQTLALAGLVQNRVESVQNGFPWLSDLPYLGAPFRKSTDTMNEVELLVLVTPQYVNAVDASEVPPCGPGMGTQLPSDHDFYWKGHIEVPSNGPCSTGNCNSGCYGYDTGSTVNLPGMPTSNVPASGPTLAPAGTQANRDRVVAGSPYPMQQRPQPQSSSSRPVLPSAQAQVQPVPTTASRPVARPASTSGGGFMGQIGYDNP
jgi:pilus assembly protein CpaC